jgi:hypothetical protein
MPFEFERRWQRIDPLLEQLHDFALAAIDPNSARPVSAALLALYAHAQCGDPKTAHISEAFVHTLQNTWPIVAPLIMIIAGHEIARRRPVLVFDRIKEVFSVALDLTLRPPEPEKKQPDANRDRETAIKSSTQRNRHRLRLYSFPQITPSQPAG